MFHIKRNSEDSQYAGSEKTPYLAFIKANNEAKDISIFTQNYYLFKYRAMRGSYVSKFFNSSLIAFSFTVDYLYSWWCPSSTVLQCQLLLL